VPETLSQSRDRVAEIARAALSSAGEGVGPAAELAAAIATGEGNRAHLEGLARRSYGAEAPLALVLFDTDRIASYVFESNRPPVLAGASALLRELNDEIRDAYRDAVIFSGGGEGLLLVAKTRAPATCADIEARFERATGGALRVSTDWVEAWPHDLVALEPERGGGALLGTRAVLSRLRDRVRRTKDRRWATTEEVPGRLRRCASCRDRAAGETPISRYRADEKGALCDPCERRWQKGKDRIAGLSFDKVLDEFTARLGRDAAPGSRASYLGFVYADGNAMGLLFGRLGTLAELRFLSLAVGGIFAAVEGRARREVERFLGPLPAPRLPFLSFLGGGDEAIWILPGALAVRTVALLPAWLEQEAAAWPDLARLLARAGLERLTAGTGLVLSGPGYPVRYQYELAKALQKNAKKLFYGATAPHAAGDSAVDFAVLTDSSPWSEDLDSARALAFATEEKGFERSLRPYTGKRFTELVSWARGVLEPQPGAGAGVALSQLYALQSGVREGRRVFLNFLRYQIARPPAGERFQAWLRSAGCDPSDPAAIENFFIHPLAASTADPAENAARHGAWIGDLVELAPFVELASRRAAGEEVGHA
jgi:hypothetical protein